MNNMIKERITGIIYLLCWLIFLVFLYFNRDFPVIVLFGMWSIWIGSVTNDIGRKGKIEAGLE